MTLIADQARIRSATPVAALSVVEIEHYDDEVVRVVLAGRTIGFVETVGRVFVGLGGHRFDRAVEIRQSPVLETVIDALVATAA